LPQILHRPLPNRLLAAFQSCTHRQLRPMQVHSQISFHSRLLLVGSGVDAALRRSPHSHSSSYWPYGDASIAGLINLCVEVLLPHCTCPACNLSAPVIPPGAYRLRTDILIHAISVVKMVSSP